MSQLLQLEEPRITWDVLSSITSRYGQVRLARVRDYLTSISPNQVDFLTEIYHRWVDQDEFMLLKGTHRETGEERRWAVKCSKRGNDVFNKRLDEKLGFLSRLKLKKHDFFSIDDFKPHKRVMAQMLWVTLTFDSKRCSLHDAWRQISQEFNLWITNLRNEYGKIHELKFIQAFPGPGKAHGYPHFHAILFFEEANFTVFPHWETNSDGHEQLEFRIHEKEELATQGKWHSFIDVKALKSIKAAVNYCRKYGQGTYDVESAEGAVNEEALLNCTMNWYYRKQSYSLSRHFQEALSDLIKTMHGSKARQLLLDGSKTVPIWVWECLGVRSVEELKKAGLDPPSWSFGVEDPDVWEKLARREYHRETWEID